MSPHKPCLEGSRGYYKMSSDTRKEINLTIRELGLSRSLVARLARVHRSDFTDWINGNASLSQTKVAQITKVLTNIEIALKVFAQAYPNLKLDTRDPEFMGRLAEAVERATGDVAREDLERLQSEAANLMREFRNFSSLSELHSLRSLD
jgi:DNA-binding transcriptional regulator YdaS (Cro superfamily)